MLLLIVIGSCLSVEQVRVSALGAWRHGRCRWVRWPASSKVSGFSSALSNHHLKARIKRVIRPLRTDPIRAAVVTVSLIVPVKIVSIMTKKPSRPTRVSQKRNHGRCLPLPLRTGAPLPAAVLRPRKATKTAAMAAIAAMMAAPVAVRKGRSRSQTQPIGGKVATPPRFFCRSCHHRHGRPHRSGCPV